MQVQEIKGNYICFKHNKIIKMVAVDDNVPSRDLFYCDTCIEQNSKPYKMIGVDEAKELYKGKLNQQHRLNYCIIQRQQEILWNFQQQLLELKSSIVKSLDAIDRIMQQWVIDLNKNFQIKNFPNNLITGIDLLQQGQRDTEREIKLLTNSYLMKINEAFQKLITMDEIKQCHQDLMNLKNVQIKSPNEEKVKEHTIEQSLISCVLDNQLRFEDQCYAIAFNNTGSIMVSGSLLSISVWQFDNGKLDLLVKLSGSSRCLVYSKKKQFFISGDSCGQVSLWKQGQHPKQWFNGRIEGERKDCINCMILNKNEDELISCSWSEQILIWKVDYENNYIIHTYSLQITTENYIIKQMSLNELNNYFITQHQKEIALWVKGSDDRWMFQYLFKFESGIGRLCFINNNEFIVQQMKGYSNIFKVEDNRILEQLDSKPILTRKCCDDYLFPTIYNKKNNVILQKVDNYIYLLQRQYDGQFVVQTKPINCESFDFIGTMTEDGQYVAIYIEKIKVFRIYKLIYL